MSVLTVLLLVLTSGCEKEPTKTEVAAQDNISVSGSEQSEATASQVAAEPVISGKQLIELAGGFGSVIPLDPYLKVRARVMEQVAMTCIESGDYQLATQNIQDIPNWRRGACFGELAIIYARDGQEQKALEYIELAGEIRDDIQQWRNDRIELNLAKAYTLLGKPDKAAECVARVSQVSLTLEVVVTGVIAETDPDIDACIAAIEKYNSTHEFHDVNNSMNAYIELYRHHYGNEQLRKQIEQKIYGSFDFVPVSYAFHYLYELTDVALDNEDAANAVLLIDRLDHIVSKAMTWPVEARVSLQSDLSGLKYRAGAEQEAIKELEATLALFISEGEKIIDMYRAENLCRLAQAWQTCGNSSQALAVYKLATEHAMKNINLRPQAEDLAGICCSMALSEVSPDEDLWKQMNAIYKDLGTK